MLTTPVAKRFKVIAITRDLSAVSGTVSYTGVGFKPVALIAVGGLAGSGLPDVSTVVGSDGTGGGVSTFGAGSSLSIAQPFSSATGSGAFQSATVTYTIDGFDLNWTKTGSPTGVVTYYVLCFG